MMSESQIFAETVYHLTGTPSTETLTLLKSGGARKCGYLCTRVTVNIVADNVNNNNGVDENEVFELEEAAEVIKL